MKNRNNTTQVVEMTSTENTSTEHNNENGTNQQYEQYGEADAQALTEDNKQNHQNDTVIEIKKNRKMEKIRKSAILKIFMRQS